MRWNRSDVAIFATLAEYRVLTARMLAMIQGRNSRALCRRLRAFFRPGYVAIAAYARRTGPGRLDRILSLSPGGVAELRTRHVLDAHIPDDRVIAPAARLIPHLLMTNEFRVRLVEMERRVPELAVRFLAPTSPFLPEWADDQPFVHEAFQTASGRRCEFTPDGVFAMTHAKLGKTLLTFLEVDRGTESLGAPGSHRGSMWQKLAKYEAYYEADQYKRYEHVFECRLRRFRLCLVAPTTVRLGALCALVREMGADFVLLASQAEIAEQGASAPVWINGGQLDRPRVSLVGEKLSVQAAAPAGISKPRR